MKDRRLFLLLTILTSCEAKDDYTFSGVYNPDVSKGMQWYAGSYLIPKKSLLQKRKPIDDIRHLEQGSGSVIVNLHNHGSQESCRQIVMTRDYFDFMVEHLSAFTNTLEGSKAHPSGE